MDIETVSVHPDGAPIGLRTALVLLALLAGTLLSEGILESWAAAPDSHAQATRRAVVEVAGVPAITR